MNKLTRTILGSTAAAGLATLAPLSFDAGAAANGGAPIRLSEVGCQSTTCKLNTPNFACITSWGYINNATCATGCS